MGLVCPELSLDLKPSYVPETINGFLRKVSLIHDKSERLDKLDDFVNKLQDELNKIEVFKRELPLCMLLLKDAMLYVKQETIQYKTKNAHQPVLEEFIPLKRDLSCVEITQMKTSTTVDEDSGRDKKNWMSSVQLWVDDLSNKNTTSPHLRFNQSNNLVSQSQKGDEKINQIVGSDLFDLSEVKAGSKGFVPLVHSYPASATTSAAAATAATAFPIANKKVDKEDVNVPGLTLVMPGMITHPPEEESISRVFDPKLEGARISNSSSPASNGRPSNQQASSRKQRRCWSPELHRRFVDALTQLGGAQVATPKQIRELMRVDGLTNDEVKSHLQKYRLHNKRVPNDTANKKGHGLSDSWPAQDQYSESSKPSSSQSASPEGPLQFTGLTGGTSTTGGDSMEDEDDEKSESHSWKGHLHGPGKDDV